MEREQGDWGTLFGDILLQDILLERMYAANPEEFKEVTGHTWDSFLACYEANKVVCFGAYRVKIMFNIRGSGK